jgi:hypothetical protein
MEASVRIHCRAGAFVRWQRVALVSDPFYRPPARQPHFHGRVSTNRADRGFENYLALTTGNYRMHIFLNGKEHPAVTADPEAGIIETYQGDRKVILQGHVEVRLERKPSSWR